MRTVRTLLCTLYGFTGILVLFSAWRFLQHAGFLNADLLDGRLGMLRLLLGLVAASILPVTGTLMLLAAFTYWARWRSARLWCVAVSFAFLVVPAIAVLVLWRFAPQYALGFLKDSWLLLGLGLLSIPVFWNWKPSQEAKPGDSAQRGDGTISLLNRLAPVLEWVGFYAIWDAWMRWAAAVGQPRPGLSVSMLQITIATLVVVALHEAGHALTGIAVGMKVRSFVAGPFQWRHDRGRWAFGFNALGLLQSGGATGVVPTRLDLPKTRELAAIAAGPLANLATGIPALVAASAAVHTGWFNYWYLLAVFGSVSLLAAVINLVPFRTAAGYSDGARILQLLRGGLWADLHRAVQINMATTITPLRPRDYDLDALHRVLSAGIPKGPTAFVLRLLAHSCRQDRSQMEDASNELSDLEPIYQEFSAKIPSEWHYEVVIDSALQRRDAARARLWWDRAKAKKPKVFSGDYWMARSALAWIEGDLDEARSAWAKADGYLRGMPRTGTYEFDRDCLAALARTIASDPVARVADLVPVGD